MVKQYLDSQRVNVVIEERDGLVAISYPTGALLMVPAKAIEIGKQLIDIALGVDNVVRLPKSVGGQS